LTAGYDIQTLEQVRNLQELLQEVENQIRDVRDKLAPHGPDDAVEGLEPAEQTRLISLQDLWRKHTAKQQEMTEVLRSLERQRGKRSQSQINVRKQVHPGVAICFDGRYHEIKEAQDGPLSMVSGPDGGLTLQPLQPFKAESAAPDAAGAAAPAPARHGELVERIAFGQDQQVA